MWDVINAAAVSATQAMTHALTRAAFAYGACVAAAVVVDVGGRTYDRFKHGQVHPTTTRRCFFGYFVLYPTVLAIGIPAQILAIVGFKCLEVAAFANQVLDALLE